MYSRDLFLLLTTYLLQLFVLLPLICVRKFIDLDNGLTQIRYLAIIFINEDLSSRVSQNHIKEILCQIQMSLLKKMFF